MTKLQDTSSYVIIDMDPGSWPKGHRWPATIGAKVRVRSGINAGDVGIIVGHARGQKAARRYEDNRQRALAEQREMTADDHECLIDEEGPLVKFPGIDELDWFPGQALGVLEYVPPAGRLEKPLVISAETIADVERVDALHETERIHDNELAETETTLEGLSVSDAAELIKNTKNKSDIAALIVELSKYLGQ